MSHSVTVRTTTTSTSTSLVVLNTGYLKTVPGLLKLAQLIIGAVCVGVVLYNRSNYAYLVPDLYFLLIATSCVFGTFCLLISCIFSLSTGGIISKTIYELIYHSIAAISLLIVAAYLLISINDYKHTKLYDTYIVVAVLALINVILYVFSAVLAKRSYRGI